jgi:hypothetical protein
MAHWNKCLQIPILLCLLFGSAQPGANFLACTVRMHDLARTTAGKDDCCGEEKASACTSTPDRAESIRARAYLPCCDSVVPFESVSEHLRNLPHHAIELVSFLPGLHFPPLPSQFVEWRVVPPPADVGGEILTLNLRI